MSIDSVKKLQEQLTAPRNVLERLEAGRLITRQWVCGQGWRHTTQREIERYKKDISEYERLIAQVRAKQ
jgi:hypothetical protein